MIQNTTIAAMGRIKSSILIGRDVVTVIAAALLLISLFGAVVEAGISVVDLNETDLTETIDIEPLLNTGDSTNLNHDINNVVPTDVCYVLNKIDDDTCVGYDVYVDGVYRLTEGQGTTPDGYCEFYVTEGTHTIEIRDGGCSASVTNYFECGYTYRWVSMPDNWCRCDECPNPPTVQFDQSTYEEGDTVHTTVSSSHYSVYYEIEDCSGVVRDSGYISSGSSSIYYTIPQDSTSSCCYWTICFYWNDNSIAGYYQCSKCYTFYVCPDICEVYLVIDDDTCVGYEVYVDGVYQFTEGQGTTPDGYCAFHVTEGYHTIEIRKDGCSASDSANFVCGYSYTWNDMPDDWCGCCVEPDLIVQGISTPGSSCIGDSATFTITIKNIGTETAGSSTVKYYVGGSYKGYSILSSLAPGATATKTFSYTPDTCGNLQFRAVADANNNVDECEEGNNDRQESFVVDGPDLIVQDIIFPTGTVCLGETIAFTATVKNQGGCTADPSVVKYYVNNQYITYNNVPSLSPGATSNQTFTWTSSSCGSVSVKAIADANGNVAECNEYNNDRQETVVVDGPDLVIGDIALPTGTVCLGEPTTFTVTVKNEGGCTAGSSIVRYYINGVQTDFDSVSSLSPGSTSTQTFTWTSNSCGSVSVKAVADANNNVHECDENNNEKQKNVEVEGPDLIVEDIILPTGTVCLDQPITITVKVKNDGECATGSSTVKYYVDGQETDSDYISGLSPGATSAQTFTWTPTTCGTHTIKAIADVNDDVKECDENNNELQKSIEVDGPDLIIQEITLPTGTVCIDNPITVTVKVKNDGGCTAGSSTVKYYVDGQEIASDPIPSLGAGSTSTHTFTWTPDTCGTHTIKAVADANKNVKECDENNNEKQKSIEVDGPDLIVENIVLPAGTVCLDRPTTITVTIKNQGGCMAGTSTAKYYVDGQETGSASIPGLSPGATSTQAFTWTPTTCGNHEIKAVADVNDGVKECDENNNELQKSIEVKGPDLIIQDITLPTGTVCLDKPTTFTVIIKNDGDCTADPSTVKYYINGGETDSDPVPSLNSGATSTQIFTWTPDSCGSASVKAIADANDDVKECDENNNVTEKDIEVDGPDLIVEEITWPPGTVCLDQPITITVTVKNQGGCDAGSSTVKYYVDGGEAGSASISGLSHGSSASNTFTWTPDTCGTHTIKAIADVNDDVKECDENNNVREKNIEVDGPDLVIEGIIPPTGTVCIDSPATITVTVKNRGGCAAGASTVKYYVDGNNVDSDNIPQLSPGSTSTQEFTWTPTSCENHEIKAVADTEKTVEECYENNNEKITSVIAKCPDLRVEDIEWNPPDLEIDESITFTVTIKNHGECDAGASHAKLLIDGSEVNTVSIGSISAGSSTTGTFVWTASGCGDHSAKAIADCNGEVTESDDGNNERVESIHIPCPDLIIQSISPNPESPAPRQETTFTIIIKNQGDADACDSTLKCYIDDAEIWSKSIGGIPASSTSSQSCTWTGSECAAHNFKAVADAVGNSVKESDETNNDKIKPFSVVDIVKPTISISSPSDGQSFSTSTITIEGIASDNSEVSKVEVQINGEAWKQASGTTSWSTTVSLTEGSNAIAAKATDICGNDRSISITVSYNPSTEDLPDLIVEDISWIPENPESIGDPVDFHITIKNVGLGDTDTYPIYIDFVFCGSYFDQKEVESLKSGETATVSYEGIGAGPCEVKAIVDPFDGIEESDEKNNERQETMSINNIDAEFGNIQSEPSGTYKPCDNIQPHIWVKNTGEVTHEFFVSMYIENWYHSKYNYEIVDSITVDSGQEKEVVLNWDVPSSAPAGTYSVVFVLWKARVNGELEGELAGKTFDPFQIAESDHKNLAEAARIRAATMEAIWVYYNARGDDEKLNEEVDDIIQKALKEGFETLKDAISQDPMSGNYYLGNVELVSLLKGGHEALIDAHPVSKMVKIIDEMGDSTVEEVEKTGAAQALQNAGIINEVFGKKCDLRYFIDACNKEAAAWEEGDLDAVNKSLEREAFLLGYIEQRMETVVGAQYYSDDIGILKEIVVWPTSADHKNKKKTAEMLQIMALYSECGGNTYELYNQWFMGHRAYGIKANCPVTLHAYDSLGRHVGANESGGVDLEIPGAYYSGIDSHPQIIQIFGTTDYYFVVEALDQGEFNLTTESHTYEETTTVQYEHVAIGNETNVIINLSKEGYTIDVDMDGDDITDYTVDPTSVETNHPPDVSITVIPDDIIFKGNISIDYILKDLDNDSCNISARYSTDQMIWHHATMGSGGDGTIGLTSSADGVTHTYVWASDADLPNISSVVYFEIRPNDGMTDGIYGISNAFYVGEVTAAFTYSPSNPSVSKHVIFAAYASIGNITNYAWNFGDGDTMSTTEPITMYSYTSVGAYTVNLTVTDNEGSTNTTSMNVTVRAICGCGDLNSDGILTPADAAIALQIAASGGWDSAADVDGDNQITSLDALMILQAAADAIDL